MLRARLSAWYHASVKSLKEKWWIWIWGLVVVLSKDRAVSTLNAWIDRQTGWVYSMLKGYVSPLLAYSDAVAISVFICVMLTLFVHAYFDTRKPNLAVAGSDDGRLSKNVLVDVVDKSRPRPRIECFDWDAQLVKADEFILQCDPSCEDFVIVLCFRNVPSETEKVGTANIVQAEIIFRLPDGTEHLRVHHGHWLGAHYNRTSFAVNAKRDLVVLFSKKAATKPGLYAVHDEREDNMRYPKLVFTRIDKDHKHYQIDVILVIDDIQMSPIRYDLFFDPDFDLKRIS